VDKVEVIARGWGEAVRCCAADQSLDDWLALLKSLRSGAKLRASPVREIDGGFRFTGRELMTFYRENYSM
jgi:hypothetical protein